MKRSGETFIAENFELTAATIKWVESRYPQVDIPQTLDRFKRKADAEGWMYRNWQRAFENCVLVAMEKDWRGIVVLKGGKEYDPKWMSLLAEARAEGFREPHEHETPMGYRTQLDMHRKTARVVDFGSVIRRVAK